MLFVSHGATPWQEECAICHPQLVWNIHGNMDGTDALAATVGPQCCRRDNFFAQHSSDCILASLAFKIKKKHSQSKTPNLENPCSTYVLLRFYLFSTYFRPKSTYN